MVLRDEFLINMQKFASSITRTIQQIEGEVKLECPDIPDMKADPEENIQNEEVREQVPSRRWMELLFPFDLVTCMQMNDYE